MTAQARGAARLKPPPHSARYSASSRRPRPSCRVQRPRRRPQPQFRPRTPATCRARSRGGRPPGPRPRRQERRSRLRRPGGHTPAPDWTTTILPSSVRTSASGSCRVRYTCRPDDQCLRTEVVARAHRLRGARLATTGWNPRGLSAACASSCTRPCPSAVTERSEHFIAPVRTTTFVRK